MDPNQTLEEKGIFDTSLTEMNKMYTDLPDPPTYNALFDAKEVLSASFDRAERHYQEFKRGLTPDERMSRSIKLNQLHMKIDTIKSQLKRKSIELPAPLPNLPVMATPPTTKLPKLVLPTFDGDPAKYTEFAHRFEAAVGGKDTLSGIDKLLYLKGSLTGKAKDLIESVPLTNQSFVDAIDLLKKNFGEKEIIIQTTLLQLHELPAVTYVYPIANVRQLMSNVKAKLLVLKQSEVKLEECGPVLYDAVRTKFPSSMTLLFRRLRPANQRNLANLLEYLEDDILSIEAEETGKKPRQGKSSATGYSNGSVGNQKQSQYGKGQQNTFATASSIVSPRPCVFCKNLGHKPSECKQVISPQDRQKVLRDEKRCFNCLTLGHSANQCRNRYNCFTCNKRHHTSIHFTPRERSTPIVATVSTKAEKKVESNIIEAAINTTCSFTHGETIFPSFLATAVSGNKRQIIRGILDTASNLTFITVNLQKKLELKPLAYVTLNIRTFGQSKPVEQRLAVCRIMLRNRFGGQERYLEVVVVPSIPTTRLVTDQETIQLIETKNVPLAEVYLPEDVTPTELLVGQDYLTMIRKPGELWLNRNAMLQNTIFGWVFSGHTQRQCNSVDVNIVNADACELAADQFLQKLWDLEAVGIHEAIWDDSDFLKAFVESITRDEEGRYVVPLPVNEKITQLPSNRMIAIMQLANIIRRFLRDKTRLKQYDDVITDYVRQDFATTLETEFPLPNLVYYMPHRAVVRENHPTTPVRVVFNASSPEKGLSLNNCLRDGPNLNPLIFHLLIMFRLYKLPIIADVKKAFLQITIREDHRPLLRYFWLDIQQFDNQDFNWKTFNAARTVHQMKVVSFGINSSPFLLALVIRMHLKTYMTTDKELVEQLSNQIYVDDLLTGATTPDEAITKANRIHAIFNDAKLPLVKWLTNSSLVTEEWEKQKYSLRLQPDGTALKQEKILGLIWSLVQDTLRVQIPELPSSFSNKTEFLAFFAGIFDLLGLFNPVLLQGKLFLQQTWQMKLNWKDLLPQELQEKMLKWAVEAQQLRTLEVPRYVGWTANTPWELRVFCDAAPHLYGCAAYVIRQEKNFLIASKTRLAPLKQTLTLPRAELMGGVLAVRLADKIKQQLPDEMKPFKITFYTDSQVLLAWLASHGRRWKPFVSNRLDQILTLSQPSQWSYVNTRQNPADLLTHPTTSRILQSSDLWWHGPVLIEEKKDIKEVSLPQDEELTVTAITIVNATEDEFVERRFFDFSLLCRVVARAKRWQPKAKRKVVPLDLSMEEVKKARSFLISKSQQLWYAEEIKSLQKKEALKSASELQQLDCFIDNDNLIRVGGRLQRSILPFAQKHPVVLPPRSWLTRLLILQKHRLLRHATTSDVLHSLRDEFWIPRGRQTVKSVIFNCILCQRHRGRLLTTKEAPLTPQRTIPAMPFRSIGLDYFGPFLVLKKGKLIKVWCLLFTCLLIRAVHIEAVCDMSTPTFLNAFRRFVAIRGAPETISSDNAATFGLAADQLKVWAQIQADVVVRAYLIDHRIEWSFIPVKTPHWGGAWERLVAIAKNVIRKSSTKYLMNLEEFQTLMYEVAGIMNSRPLTYVSEDVNEVRALSPNTFLTGGMPFVVMRCHPLVKQPTGKDLRKLHKKRIQCNNYAWQCWIKSYLQSMAQFHKVQQGNAMADLKEGDLVLIKQTNIHPYWWPLGRVIQLFPGTDDVVRLAEIRLGDGSVTQRVLKHLCRLEMDS